MSTMKTKLQDNIDTVSANIRGDLETVAFTGSYNDLSDQPAIPVVNDGHLNIKSGSKSLGTFTANTAGDVDIDIAPELEDYATKTKVQNDSIALATALKDSMNTISNKIPIEVRDKFTATADQTNFTLSYAPYTKGTITTMVKMYINGILVGDNYFGELLPEQNVISVTGNTVVYRPDINGNYNLQAGDKVVFYYYIVMTSLVP